MLGESAVLCRFLPVWSCHCFVQHVSCFADRMWRQSMLHKSTLWEVSGFPQVLLGFQHQGVSSHHLPLVDLIRAHFRLLAAFNAFWSSDRLLMKPNTLLWAPYMPAANWTGRIKQILFPIFPLGWWDKLSAAWHLLVICNMSIKHLLI